MELILIGVVPIVGILLAFALGFIAGRRTKESPVCSNVSLELGGELREAMATALANDLKLAHNILGFAKADEQLIRGIAWVLAPNATLAHAVANALSEHLKGANWVIATIEASTESLLRDHLPALVANQLDRHSAEVDRLREAVAALQRPRADSDELAQLRASIIETIETRLAQEVIPVVNYWRRRTAQELAEQKRRLEAELSELPPEIPMRGEHG